MADGAPQHYQFHQDDNPETSTGHTSQALRDLENLFQVHPEHAMESDIITPNAHLTNEISRGVHRNVQRAMAGDPDASTRVMTATAQAQEQIDRPTSRGRQVMDWFQSRYRRHILGEHPRPSRDFVRDERFESPLAAGEVRVPGDNRADMRARREVGKSLYTNAEAVWTDLRNAPHHEDLERELGNRLGRQVMAEAQDNPELVFTLRFLLRDVGANAPANFNRAEFIQHAIDGDHHANHERPVAELEESKAKMTPMVTETQSAATKIRQRCRTGLAAEINRLTTNIADLDGVRNTATPPAQSNATGLHRLNEEVHDAQQTLRNMAATAPGFAAAQQDAADAVSRRNDHQQRLQQARTQLSEVQTLGFDLRDQLSGLVHEIQNFYLNHHGNPPVPSAQITALTTLLDNIATGHNGPLNLGPIDAAINTITSGDFSRQWQTIQTNVDAQIATAKNTTQEAHHEQHAITPSELLYRVYLRYLTTGIDQGGILPAGTPRLTEMEINAQRPRAALFARFAISEARDASTVAANRARMQIMTRGAQRRGERVEFLPDFERILQTFQFLQVGDTKPFVKMQLRPNMTRAELRAEMASKHVDPAALPHLIANMERVLSGYNNRVIRERDVPLVLDMLRNLRVIREEDTFRGVVKRPGTFDSKLQDLLKFDTAEADAKNAINDEALFCAITDKHFVKNQKNEVLHGVQEKFLAGEIDLQEARKEMLEQGVKMGYGTWAKLVALRGGQNIARAWQNTWMRGPFAWAGRKIVNGWGKVKKFPHWLSGTRLGKAWKYSTTGDNWSAVPSIFKSGHGGGHGGGHGAAH